MTRLTTKTRVWRVYLFTVAFLLFPALFSACHVHGTPGQSVTVYGTPGSSAPEPN